MALPARTLLLGALAAGLFSLGACDSSPLSADEVRRAEIDRISVEDIPFRNPEGGSWDGFPESPDPDVYVTLEALDGQVLLETEAVGAVISRDLPIEFSIVPGYDVRSLGRDLVVAIWDEDGTTDDDLMDETEAFSFQEFLPSRGEVDRSFSIVLRSPNGPGTVRLRGRWLD